MIWEIERKEEQIYTKLGVLVKNVNVSIGGGRICTGILDR
jgi:hypothetical protein